MTTDSTPPEARAAALVPVLATQDGGADAAAVGTWHLALSNLVGLDVPHDLLALWLFPDQGGVVLLAPTELAEDRLEVPVPDPHLSQHQLFSIEDRVRRAGYRSVVAVPVRGAGRDLGLVLFAALEPGRYGVAEAVSLHALVSQLARDFAALAAAPPVPATATAATTTPETVVRHVALACAEGRTGPEVLRLVSATLQQVLPHERIEVAVAGSSREVWALLSSAPECRRWGESTAAVSRAMAGLLASASEDGSLAIADLRDAGVVWPSYREHRALQRVRTVAGQRLRAAGVPDAWLLLGGPAPGMFTPDDQELLAGIAPVLALRVHALRAQLDADVVRAQASAVAAAQARATRIATVLATTPHWGEAMGQVAQEIREALGYRTLRVALRLGEDRFVVLEPGDVRPITSLAPEPLDGTDLATVLSGVASFLVFGPDGTDLAVPVRVAGRVVGALDLLGGAPGAGGHPVTAAQLVADLLAPHFELLRRSALPAPTAAARRAGAGAPQP